MRCRFIIMPMLLLLASASLSAAMISVSPFTQTAYNSAISGYDILASEDFEDFTIGNVDDMLLTDIGTFSSAGGTGSGSSVINDGSKLAIREGSVFGRSSTTSTLSNDTNNDQFLDSNDTFGIKWNAAADGNLFNRLVLTITDAGEFENMVIEVGDMSLSLEDLDNAVSLLLQIDLDSSVSSQTVYFRNFNQNDQLAINDGFSLDDIAIVTVPLPMAWFLFLGALSCLVFTRQRNCE